MYSPETLKGMNRKEAQAYEQARREREKRHRLRLAGHAGEQLREAGITDETVAAFITELDPDQVAALHEKLDSQLQDNELAAKSRRLADKLAAFRRQVANEEA